MTDLDVDKLPATQFLVLEVLASRYRLGEGLWTFSRTPAITKAIKALESLGLVYYKSGVVQNTWMVFLTDLGKKEFLYEGYHVPDRISIAEHRLGSIYNNIFDNGTDRDTVPITPDDPDDRFTAIRRWIGERLND